jgi:hypothetical protein
MIQVTDKSRQPALTSTPAPVITMQVEQLMVAQQQHQSAAVSQRLVLQAPAAAAAASGMSPTW